MLHIERAGVKDHGVVAGLVLSFSRMQGWKPEVDRDSWDRILAELLNSDGWMFIIAREESEPVGLAVVNFNLALYGSREQARLAALIVEEAYRRRKIGKRLMDEVLRAVRGRGCRELEVSVDPDDQETLGFYKGFEFKQKRELLIWPCEE